MIETGTSSYTHRLEGGQLVYCSEAVDMLHYGLPTGFGFCPHDEVPNETVVHVEDS